MKILTAITVTQTIARAEAQSPSGVYGWFTTKLMMLKTAKRSEIY